MPFAFTQEDVLVVKVFVKGQFHPGDFRIGPLSRSQDLGFLFILSVSKYLFAFFEKQKQALPSYLTKCLSAITFVKFHFMMI